MHLYLDTFISEVALSPNRKLESFLREVQGNSFTYRKQTKIDILRYTIASYAEATWSDITVRIDGDDKEKIRELGQYISECMPSAQIYYERSDSGKKYVDALESMLPNNPWIFFTPNNDHPYIHRDAEYLKSLQASGEKAEEQYGLPVTILYSHFTESINSILPNRYLYGYTGDFCNVVHEDENSYWVLRDQMPLLSTHIYRANDLYAIMKSAGDNRVIRTECLGKFLPNKIETIQIVPKEECCRHYDAYMHTAFVVKDFISAKRVPPLFIPDGFFDNDIKIKYGYDSYTSGYVNINPEKRRYIFEESRGVDLGTPKGMLPSFWNKRISHFEINPKFDIKDNHNSYLCAQVANPWSAISPPTIALIVGWRRFFYKCIKPIIGNSYAHSRIFVSNWLLKPLKKTFIS